MCTYTKRDSVFLCIHACWVDERRHRRKVAGKISGRDIASKLGVRISESNGCDHRGMIVFHNLYFCVLVGLFKRQHSGHHPLHIKGGIANEASAAAPRLLLPP